VILSPSVHQITWGYNHRTLEIVDISPPTNEQFKREQLRLNSERWRNTAGVFMIQSDLVRQAADLMSCSDPARAWQALACPNGHEEAYQPIVPSCKLPYCPVCAHARSAELAREYTPIVQDALNASPDSHKLRHITLTTPYSIEHSQINGLAASSWRKAISTIEAALGIKQRNWKKQDIGVLGGWEFGGKGLKLHVHLLILSPWIDQEILADCWRQATNGVCEIVWIRKVNGVESGVKEVTKYATKLTELPPQLVPALHTILSGKRRIRAYGAFSWKLDAQESRPQTCPVCGELLELSPLLNLRLGNNFAGHNHTEPVTDPQTASIPPPTQHEFPDLVFRRSETYKFFEE
jgi:hypothetical protein